MIDSMLLQSALDEAVARHFSTLFEVMLVEADTDKAMKRFNAGLTRLIEREHAVRVVINSPKSVDG